MLNEKHTREILTTQLESQQQTMQHIGIEIHDNVGQKLTLASLYSKQLTAGAEDIQGKISLIGNIIDEALAELRQLSKTLTNPSIADAGILELLFEEAKRINASSICYLNVTAENLTANLPYTKRNILFRLLQEFIQNSLKHAACRKINIHLEQKNGFMEITASDDGKGFRLTDFSTGIGLQNMKRRADQLAAIFELKTGEGKGTILFLQFPFN